MELILPSFCFVVGTSRHAPSQKSFRVSAEPPPGATVHRPAHGGRQLETLQRRCYRASACFASGPSMILLWHAAILG